MFETTIAIKKMMSLQYVFLIEEKIMMSSEIWTGSPFDASRSSDLMIQYHSAQTFCLPKANSSTSKYA